MPILKNKTAQVEAWQIPPEGAEWPPGMIEFARARILYPDAHGVYQEILTGPKAICRPFLVRSRPADPEDEDCEITVIEEARPGDWVVKLSNGNYIVFCDLIFNLLFESAGMKTIHRVKSGDVIDFGVEQTYTAVVVGQGGGERE